MIKYILANAHVYDDYVDGPTYAYIKIDRCQFIHILNQVLSHFDTLPEKAEHITLSIDCDWINYNHDLDDLINSKEYIVLDKPLCGLEYNDLMCDTSLIDIYKEWIVVRSSLAFSNILVETDYINIKELIEKLSTTHD
jgi:hypothetical protein